MHGPLNVKFALTLKNKECREAMRPDTHKILYFIYRIKRMLRTAHTRTGPRYDQLLLHNLKVS